MQLLITTTGMVSSSSAAKGHVQSYIHHEWLVSSSNGEPLFVCLISVAIHKSFYAYSSALLMDHNENAVRLKAYLVYVSEIPSTILTQL